LCCQVNLWQERWDRPLACFHATTRRLIAHHVVPTTEAPRREAKA
jgi:hypothetical protein